MEWVIGADAVGALGGLEAVQAEHVKERARQCAAAQRLEASWDDPDSCAAQREAIAREMAPLPPLWQRICGFTPRNELVIPVGERRAGIRKLMQVFERMYRTELRATADDRFDRASAESGEAEETLTPHTLQSSRFAFRAAAEAVCDGSRGVERDYSQRCAVWDPIHEICVYLEISKAKLNALSMQRTGLRAADIGDCIRAEKLRAHLKATFEPLAWQWFGTLEVEEKLQFADDFENAPWRFLKWVRGRGAGLTRRKLAFELGLSSREKLDRAALVGEGLALEAIEVEVAREVLRVLHREVRPQQVQGATESGVWEPRATPEITERAENGRMEAGETNGEGRGGTAPGCTEVAK